MTGTTVFAPGGYRYIPAVFQHSGGVAAEDGFELERARFLSPLPLADAFARVEAHLKSIGRPSTAFAACELRSPGQFTDQGFIDFNKTYVGTLKRWGIYQGEAGDANAINPVARMNAEFNHTLADPGVRKLMNERGLEPIGGTVDAFEAHIRSEIAKYAQVVKQSNMKID